MRRAISGTPDTLYSMIWCLETWHVTCLSSHKITGVGFSEENHITGLVSAVGMDRISVLSKYDSIGYTRYCCPTCSWTYVRSVFFSRKEHFSAFALSSVNPRGYGYSGEGTSFVEPRHSGTALVVKIQSTTFVDSGTY